MSKKIIRLDSSFTDRDRRMLASGQLLPGFLAVNKISDTAAEVFIYGDIGGWYDGITAEGFVKELSALEVTHINAKINSGGGVISEGVAIYNGLARHQAKVTMHIEGIAASIASVIAMAGDEILIYEGAREMIHDPWSFAMGNADDMRKEAEVLDGFKSDIVDLYQARTGRDRAEIARMMADETWMSAREAVEHGFADQMIEAKQKPKAAHSAMMRLYSQVPHDMLGQDPVTIRDLEDILQGSGGFSKSQSRAMASQAMNRISGGGRWDAALLPRWDAGKEDDAMDLIQALNSLAETIKP